MFPSQFVFPMFVSNQLLTSGDLNNLFGYLDDQNRMTRTNLIGIGIVCGLQVKVNSAKTTIVITKGCGITSKGYLISMEGNEDHPYTQYETEKYKVDTELVYNDFYRKDGSGNYLLDGDNKRIPMDIWLLQKDAVSGKTTTLDEGFLTDKMVILFVELKALNSKNCSPDSCDDKGTKVTVSFLPLLITNRDAEQLTQPGATSPINFNRLPAIFIPRWDVPRTNPVNAGDIVYAYESVFTETFIKSVKRGLDLAYHEFSRLIGENYPVERLEYLYQFLSVLNKRALRADERIYIQYYYDFISDLIEAYNEICITGSGISGTCCPDDSLFPRHLLLGDVITLPKDEPFLYRYYFMHSPLFQHKDLIFTLRSLFRRIDLMIRSFTVPPVEIYMKGSKNDQNIIITPSRLSFVPLSAKAIPYYYDPLPLYKYWSFEKSFRGRAEQILSYNSKMYREEDDFVTDPLKYDLEQYNFFRIEGIIGKPYDMVLETIRNCINDYRLPFQVLAVETGGVDQKKTIGNGEVELFGGTGRAGMEKMLREVTARSLEGTDDIDCGSFSNMELQYQLLRSQLHCCLKTNIIYWGAQKLDSGKKRLVGMPEKLAEPKLKEVKEDTEAGQVLEVFLKGQVLSGLLHEITEDSIAYEYMRYQKNNKNVSMSILPPPRTDAPGENISYYILIILDELIESDHLLAEKNIDSFDYPGFLDHVIKLDDTCSMLDKLLRGYHTVYTTAYLVNKIRKNTSKKQSAYVERIAKVMPEMNEDDAYKIMYIFLFLPDDTGGEKFAGDMEAKKNNYYDQQQLIDAYFNQKKGDIPPPDFEEPEQKNAYPYGLMQERLKNRICGCDIENLLYLIKRYRQLRSKVSDVNNFYGYAKNHPGLQHKAGVTVGGTFVIVYKGSDDKSVDIKEGTVTGDFYLPYLCCTDCRPVINAEPPAPPEPEFAFSIKPNKFLFDDAHNYPFNVKPLPKDMGEIDNPDKLNILIEDGALYLHPAMEINETLQATLTYKGNLLSITIIKPDATFTVAVLESELAIQFMSEQQDADAKYDWVINNLPYNGSRVILERELFKGLETVSVELTVTYEINDNISTDTKQQTIMTGKL